MNKTRIKKIISTCLTLTLLTSISTSVAFANENTDNGIYQNSSISSNSTDNLAITTVEDTSSEKTVKVVDSINDNISTATFNKLTGEVQVTENGTTYKYSTSSNLQSTSLNNQPRYAAYSNNRSSGYNIDTGNDLDHKYFYAVYSGNPRYWSVKIPGSNKYVPETAPRSSSLNGFRSSVNGYTNKQLSISASATGSALGIIVAQITAAPATLGVTAITAILSAAGLGAVALAQGVDLYGFRKDIIYYYNCI